MMDIRFAGPDSDYPLRLGKHITFRLRTAKYESLEPGDRIRVIDEENAQVGYAEVLDTAVGLHWDTIAGLGHIEEERPAFRESSDLANFLLAAYGDEVADQRFVAIMYVVFLTEVLEAPDDE